MNRTRIALLGLVAIGLATTASGQGRTLGIIEDTPPAAIAVPADDAAAKRIVEAYWNKELGDGEPRPKVIAVLDYGPAKQFSVYNDRDPGFKFWTNQAYPSASDTFIAVRIQFPSKPAEIQAYFFDKAGANVQVFSKYKRLTQKPRG